MRARTSAGAPVSTSQWRQSTALTRRQWLDYRTPHGLQPACASLRASDGEEARLGRSGFTGRGTEVTLVNSRSPSRLSGVKRLQNRSELRRLLRCSGKITTWDGDPGPPASRTGRTAG